MAFIRVAVNLPAVSGEFDYRLPAELEGAVGVGQLLTVPFGNQTVQGVVLDFVSQPAVADTKPVLALVDETPVLTSPQIFLARQLAESTLNPLAAIVNLMIPPGLAQQADTQYLVISDQSLGEGQNTIQKRLLALLKERGSLRGRQIDKHFGPLEWRKTAQWLARAGILKSKPVLPPPTARAKFIRVAQLAVTPTEAEAALPTLGKTPATLERRQKALRFLIREPEAVAVSWVYAESGCNLADLQELAERELIAVYETEIFRDPLRKIGDSELGISKLGDAELVLTPEQDAALTEILRAFQSPSDLRPPTSFLLHGVTGSGKTEIYLRAAAEAIRRGKQSIILVPEIALTPQTVRRFLARFPGQVGLFHSRLSDGERYDTWRRARAGQLKVIIGARSALFTPLPNIGLIVADECHDHSYYQSEPPFYHAIRAAQMYAKICGAVCVLGSATPPLELKYRALTPPPLPKGEGLVSHLPLGEGSGVRANAGVRVLDLPNRVVGAQTEGVFSLPPVSIVDMREELKTGNRGIFSRELAESLAETLERGEQAILFLNRRGTATYVFCRDCGYVAKCPHCETPLTQHVESQKSKVGVSDLRCHRCGYVRQIPKKCPACGGTQIRAYGLGSEKVESEVQALFPNARPLRWDWETTREKDAHEIILTHFANHQADVLVGTQMLAKGLDLPLVTLVGIVLADVGLTLPDPFAAERSFQLLTQVAGRAGRSARGGKVVMQTFMPDNPIIQLAARHDYAGFYAWEIENRRKLGYPPFARLLRLEYRHRDPVEAEKQAQKLAETLKAQLEAQNTQHAIRTLPENSPRVSNYEIIGPAPCFFAKMNDFYRWQILLRGPDPVSQLKTKIPDGWRIEVDPPSLL